MYDAIADSVERTGLRVRGGFHPGPGDAVPRLRSGAEASTLILVGNVGSSVWKPFAASEFPGRSDHPLDGWSRKVVSKLGRQLGAEPLFPFGGPPFLPFIRWALRADTVWPSVMGPLIHPRFGLWHAYRGALRVPRALRPSAAGPGWPAAPATTAGSARASPPVRSAQSREGAFDAAGCADWLTERPGCECREAGCLARRACPVGREHAYRPAHAAFPHGGVREGQLHPPNRPRHNPTEPRRTTGSVRVLSRLPRAWGHRTA